MAATTKPLLVVEPTPFVGVWPGPQAPALDMHEVKSTPSLTGCERWPSSLWLLSSTGAKVPGRCGASIQCDYCAKLAAVEYSESLALDALKGCAPEVWMC